MGKEFEKIMKGYHERGEYGRSESVNAITKFRMPEGVSWVEPRGAP